ncbi:MAG: type III pantothenate kinase [Akkermansiaceae bacterium]|nr:type III pantothenate kinase [Akkermansiaceae bacterium]
MTYLLIDNSNTRTKFVLSTPEALLKERRMIPTREVSEERLDDALKGLHYDAAVVCSVVPRVADVLRNWLTRPSHFLSCDSRLGVGIDYPSPRQIGADRLANAAGAVAYYGYPCIVVDFGTAVTFDVIGPERTYLGGAIAPGLASMGDYLARNTALLPAIEPHEPKHAIGTSTVEAMHSGAVYGYRGMVKEILAKLEEEMGTRPTVVATGGDAALIARGVPRIDHVDPDITLNGLRMVAGLNL